MNAASSCPASTNLRHHRPRAVSRCAHLSDERSADRSSLVLPSRCVSWALAEISYAQEAHGASQHRTAVGFWAVLLCRDRRFSVGRSEAPSSRPLIHIRILPFWLRRLTHCGAYCCPLAAAFAFRSPSLRAVRRSSSCFYRLQARSAPDLFYTDPAVIFLSAWPCDLRACHVVRHVGPRSASRGAPMLPSGCISRRHRSSSIRWWPMLTDG